jgi:hypothetical protein
MRLPLVSLKRMARSGMLPALLAALAALAGHLPCSAQFKIEEPPIEYSKTEDQNAVTALIAKIEAGEVSLEYERGTGYLRSLLKELDVPVSSQALVFSKTSMQVRYISPRNPRAIYFNDDVYVGWVRGSSLMEISAADPKIGAAFYTVEMTPYKASIERAGYDCLACHTTTLTQGVPGHTVRSVHPMVDGTIDPQKQSFVTDHTSPIGQRWGGWYVTGRHGEMQHMGNAFLRGGRLETRGEPERLNLRDEFHTIDWLSPYSDIVALMVLEHQTQMHNAFTRADFTVRHAVYEHNLAYGLADPDTTKPVPPDAEEELQARISLAAKEVVDYMLFVNEAPLTSEIKGSVVFAGEFTKRGPSDPQGRSLRDLDLRTRLFRFPCSYLIYSPAFDSLGESLRQQIYVRLWSVLQGNDRSDKYKHLDNTVRASIVEILRETKAGLPAYWTKPESQASSK